MTIKEIKKIANDKRCFAHRFKAMPFYGLAFFVMVNIILLSAVIYAFLTVAVGRHIFIAVIIGGYCTLLLLLALCLSGQFSYSMDEYFLRVVEGESDVTQFSFCGYNKKNFVKTMLARVIGFFVSFVLTCLAIVPGVIFGIKTSMTHYVMKKDPAVGFTQAMRKSSVVMKGHSLQYLRLGFSFLGWFLLCIITLGLGFIFVLPYFNSCKAVFFNSISNGEIAESDKKEEITETEDVKIEDVPVVEVSDGDEPVFCVPVTEEAAPIVEAQAESSSEELVASQAETIIIAPVAAENETEEKSDEPIVIIPADDHEGNNAEQTVTVQAEPPVQAAKAGEQEKQEEPVTAAESDSHDPHSRDAIKQRIEQLKRERNAHVASARPQRPVAHDDKRAAAAPKGADTKQSPLQKPLHVNSAHSDLPKREKKSDEFAPEKIEVEIVED